MLELVRPSAQGMADPTITTRKAGIARNFCKKSHPGLGNCKQCLPTNRVIAKSSFLFRARSPFAGSLPITIWGSRIANADRRASRDHNHQGDER